MWLVLLIVPLGFAADRLLHYKYGGRSKLAMVGAGVVSFVLAGLFVQSQWPGLDIGTRLLITLGGTVPVFIIVALAVAEVWRARKLQVFAGQVHALRGQLVAAEERLFAIERRRRAVSGRKNDIDERHRGQIGELTELKGRIAAWEEGGGLTRVRSVKLEEWRADMSVLTPEKQQSRRHELELELSRALERVDDELAESINIRLSLLRLMQLDGGFSASREIEELGRILTDTDSEQAETKAEIERIKREIGEWEQRRTHYVETGIILD